MSNAASVTCNLVYSLLSSPSWSNNCDIELILSDIPFISVGILAFGLSMFFLAIRRFTFSVVSLYFSVLLSFTAAIIDLTQNLIHDLSHVTIWPLITTREVLLAMSLGLRLLFYWLYVSEPPIEEQRSLSFHIGLSNFLSLDRRNELHCGNWARWGIAGCYARFTLLATILVITALQIIWRVSQRYHNYSPVYAADATLEVIVSVLLLLKLLLNAVPSSSVPRTYTFKECSFSALALVFNIGISIGGLFQFAFTESIVGRLFQGVELYILIVFTTICHLFSVQTVPHARDFATRKVVLPEQLRASTFRLSLPVVSTPSLSTPLSSGIQGRSINTDATRHSYRASVGRAIPWVPWRVSRIQSDQEEDRTKLWDQGKKGSFGPPDANPGNTGHRRMASAASVMDEEFTSWRGIANDPVPYSPATAAPDNLSVNITSKDGSLNNEHSGDAIRVSKRSLGLRTSLTAIPATVTSSNESRAAVIMTAPPESPSQDLPVIYEFNGTTGQSPTSSWKHASGTSFDQFRELQNELDKIIMALQQFSPRSPVSPTPTSSSKSDSGDDGQMLQPSSATRQSSSSDRPSFSTVGARTLSDFSLSNFPDPPWLSSQVPSLPTLLPAHNPRLKEGRRARLALRQDSSPDILPLTPPPRIPAALTDVPSSPHSDLTSHSPYQSNENLPATARRPSRFNSGGTQYEITSFIGNLTTPDCFGDPMSGISLDEFRENFAGATEDSNFQECLPPIPTTTTLRSSPLRATTLSESPPSSTRHRLSSLSMQERLSSVPAPKEHNLDPNSELVEPTVQRGIRSLILPSMTITPSPQSQPSGISSNARPPRTIGLPPRPRCRAKPQLENAQASRASGRLKPLHSISRSDDEYFSKRAE